MRLINNQISTKLIVNTEVGDLIGIEHKGVLSYGIVIDTEENRKFIGSITPIEGISSYRIFAAMENKTKCISYGNEWYLKTIFTDASLPGNRQFIGTGGCIHLDGDDYIIVFEEINGADCRYFNLSQNQVCHSPSEIAVPILIWSAWKTQSEPNEFRPEPIISIDLSDHK